MQKLLCGIFFGLLAVGSANAALVSRSGGLAYYDTETNLTWVADANLAQTSGYDADGLMDWTQAMGWIASLNTASYLSTNDWRLPTVTDTGSAGCTSGPWVELYPGTWGQYNGGTDCGYNVDPATGEMAHLFHSTLGNVSFYDAYFNTPASCVLTLPVCLANTGPFSNIQPWIYWSGTTYALDPNSAWYFGFDIGSQSFTAKDWSGGHVWAVRSGDIEVIPLPPAVWLFGSALGVMGWLRRKAS